MPIVKKRLYPCFLLFFVFAHDILTSKERDIFEKRHAFVSYVMFCIFVSRHVIYLCETYFFDLFTCPLKKMVVFAYPYGSEYYPSQNQLQSPSVKISIPYLYIMLNIPGGK